MRAVVRKPRAGAALIVLLAGLRAPLPAGTSAPLRIPVAGGTLREEMRRAARFLAGGHYEQGLTALRSVLATGEDALLPVDGAPNRYIAADIKARSILGSLSSEGRRTFRDLVAELAAEFEEDWRAGRTDRRELLARELPFTPAGRRALQAQAAELFEEGDFPGACDRWGLLLFLDEGRQLLSLHKKIALATLLAGDRRGYDEARRSIAGTQAASELAVLHAMIDRGAQAPPRGSARHVAAFDCRGGALPPAPFLHGMISWRSLPFLPAALDDWTSPILARERLNYAVSYDGRVYAADFDKVFEINGEIGKMENIYNKRHELFAPSIGRYDVDPRIQRSVQALVASDRFLIASFILDVEKPDKFWSFAITVPIPYRRLFVFARQRGELSLLWRSDGVPGLAELHVLGEPLLRGDTLYVAGWTKEGFINLYVAAVDVATGGVLWRRMLCGGQVLDNTMFGETGEEPYGVTLTTAGGLLFAVTHMGAVAALRRRDGRIRWLTTYERAVASGATGRFHTHSIRRTGVWFDNPVLLTGTEVIVGPRDSTLLVGLHRDSGKVLRSVTASSVPRKPYLLGVRQGTLYRAGPAGIDAYDLRNATLRVTPLYRTPAAIRGRPALTEQGIYCCMSGGLFFFRFGSRAMLRVASWPEEEDDAYAGDVSVARDTILVMSDQHVTAFVSAERRAP